MLEPKPFGSVRNAEDLENFLWDMKQYFIAARIPDGEQVTISGCSPVNEVERRVLLCGSWKTRSMSMRG